MKTQDIVQRVVSIPATHARGGGSIVSLLHDSGYLEFHGEVTERAIQEELLKRPAAVQEWADYSAAKRTDAGWFLRGDGGNCYQVGRYPAGDLVAYKDVTAACAAFIKREIEEIRVGGRSI